MSKLNLTRVVFPTGKQKEFLAGLLLEKQISTSEMARQLKINRRTLSDWTRGKYLLPHTTLELICSYYNIPQPKLLEIRSNNWVAPIAARMGGQATFNKYHQIGDPKIRKAKWREWWERKGKFNPNKYFIKRPILIPAKTKELAEFVGIMLGDGGVTKKQVTVTLNKNTDEKYSEFVKDLICKLFGVEPSKYIRANENVVNIVVSRVALVKFCASIGLKIGNKLKQKLDIPEWIKEDNGIQKECIRGLFDTDGCFFLETHTIKGRKYSYPRLALTSYSSNLRNSLVLILKNLGFHPVIRNNRNVQLERKKDIINYFRIIQSHNPKHTSKYIAHFGGFA